MDARGEKIVATACLEKLKLQLGNEWRELGRYLGLADPQLELIAKNLRFDGQERINFAMLEEWKKQVGGKATYNALATALRQIRRVDLAENVVHYNRSEKKAAASDNIPEVFGSTSTSGLGAAGRDEQTVAPVNISGVSESSPTSTDPGAVSSDALTQRGSARVPHYKMRSEPLGKCLILTYDEFSDKDGPDEDMSRPGNDVDAENLKKLFEKLGFDVSCKTNLNKADTMDKIKKMATKNFDSFVLFVCSHGNEKAFSTSDKEEIDIQDVIKLFIAEKCQGFASKPKMFFFNTCRGTVEEKMFEANPMELQPDFKKRTGFVTNLSYYRPNEADFCVVLSTVPGYVSWRQAAKGTIFVQDLCTSLEKNYRTHHLLDIVTMTIDTMLHKFAVKRAATGKILTKCQVPTLISTLSKAVYFVDE